MGKQYHTRRERYRRCRRRGRSRWPRRSRSGARPQWRRARAASGGSFRGRGIHAPGGPPRGIPGNPGVGGRAAAPFRPRPARHRLPSHHSESAVVAETRFAELHITTRRRAAAAAVGDGGNPAARRLPGTLPGSPRAGNRGRREEESKDRYPPENGLGYPPSAGDAADRRLRIPGAPAVRGKLDSKISRITDRVSAGADLGSNHRISRPGRSPSASVSTEENAAGRLPGGPVFVRRRAAAAGKGNRRTGIPRRTGARLPARGRRAADRRPTIRGVPAVRARRRADLGAPPPAPRGGNRGAAGAVETPASPGETTGGPRSRVRRKRRPTGRYPAAAAPRGATRSRRRRCFRPR